MMMGRSIVWISGAAGGLGRPARRATDPPLWLRGHLRPL